MNNKRKNDSILAEGKRLQTSIPKPTHYDCPEGTAYIEAAGKRIRIQVLLNSGSNIFVINRDLVDHFHIPYETRQKALKHTSVRWRSQRLRRETFYPSHLT